MFYPVVIATEVLIHTLLAGFQPAQCLDLALFNGGKSLHPNVNKMLDWCKGVLNLTYGYDKCLIKHLGCLIKINFSDDLFLETEHKWRALMTKKSQIFLKWNIILLS